MGAYRHVLCVRAYYFSQFSKNNATARWKKSIERKRVLWYNRVAKKVEKYEKRNKWKCKSIRFVMQALRECVIIRIGLFEKVVGYDYKEEYGYRTSSA